MQSIQAPDNPDVQQARSVSRAIRSPDNPLLTCEFTAVAAGIQGVEFHPFE
ncbi:MAG TPA: hypothetical protein VHV82_15670 [Sporichthyaceae bacterium]|nr:hypothetical protein [Sporichthyaceae bacterium]